MWCGQFDAAGLLPSGTAVLRAPLPVGVSRTLWMGLGPWRLDDDGVEEERVVLELLANAPGALRIEKAWKDLPRAR